jgi:hypothetical protein
MLPKMPVPVSALKNRALLLFVQIDLYVAGAHPFANLDRNAYLGALRLKAVAKVISSKV